MSNTITGKVLSIGEAVQIKTKNPDRPFYKREMVIDCTRHDPITGERSTFENTPSLEFDGEQVGELDGYKIGDVVTITFEIVGRQYVKDGVTRIFTRVRPYRIERVASSQPQQPQPQPQPQQRTLFNDNDQFPF